MSIWDKFFSKRKTPQIESFGRGAIEIDNKWGIGDGTPLLVEASPDLERIFSNPNPTVPQRITAKNREYWESVSVSEKRINLVMAYLAHPNPEIKISMLQHHIPAEVLNTIGVTDVLTDLLFHSDVEIRHEAAKVVWKCGKASLKGVFNILSSQGMTPSGVIPNEARRAVEILGDACPPEQKQLFEQLALDAFGPTVAGLKSELKSGAVYIKEKVTKPGLFGTTSTYEVYTATNKIDALAFLESREVTQKYYSIVVETPEGNWAKDSESIYEEKGMG